MQIVLDRYIKNKFLRILNYFIRILIKISNNQSIFITTVEPYWTILVIKNTLNVQSGKEIAYAMSYFICN